MLFRLSLSRSALGAFGAVLLSAMSGASAEDAGASAHALIDSFDQDLLTVMKTADTLGYDGRWKHLAPVVDRSFDIPRMTQIVAGAAWNGWTEQQRAQVVAAFRNFIISTYARRFDGYSGESFKVTGTQAGTSGTLVNSELDRPDDDPVTMNYLTKPNQQGAPRIVDIFVTGTISELATRRAEFAALLDREGFDGLLKALDKGTMPPLVKR